MANLKLVAVSLKAALVLLMVAGVCSYAWLAMRYHFAFERAMSAYRESRGPDAPPIDSEDFATWGIRYGFSEAQVDRAMQHASSGSGRLLDPQRPGFFEKYYHFLYGSVWAFGHETILIEERVWVIFDTSGKAVRIIRDLFVHNDPRKTGMKEFDLGPEKPLARTK